MGLLERDDIESALADLVDLLVDRGVTAGIRLIGGAAISIIYPDRAATADVDALLHPKEPVLEAAREIAVDRGWPEDWLNDKAAMFMSHYDAEDDWQLLVSRSDVEVWVASPRLLLGMKLHAARGPRDYDDLDDLIVACEITSYDAAVEVFESYYPEEVLKDRAERFLRSRLQRFE